LNPLSLFVLVPSLALAIFASRRSRAPEPERPTSIPRLELALALLTVASFATGFVLLKTQPVGVVRLLCGALVLGAPLAGRLLERRWMRLGALGFQIIALGAHTVVFAGAIVRRTGDTSWIGQQIAKLQRNHTVVADCRWSDRPPEKLVMREDYSNREAYLLLLSRIPSPTTFGSVNCFNSEDVYLFGPNFTNRVICLRDSKDPDHALPIPPEVEYLVSDMTDFADLDYAAHGFAVWFEMTLKGAKPSLIVLKRTVNLPAAPQ
jgi:hypothetical protein